MAELTGIGSRLAVARATRKASQVKAAEMLKIWLVCLRQIRQLR